MKEYKILEEGIDNKVLVEWNRQKCSAYPLGKEYSVHTMNDGFLIWGHYFNDLKDAEEYFKVYRKEV